MDCRCIVYHPQTIKELEGVNKALVRAKELNDSPGIELATAQLTGTCLARLKS